ncbi:MAG: insulinase family protein [Clostridiales bacterium]|nr:insulinase family protein [Clostridiales bacterium]
MIHSHVLSNGLPLLMERLPYLRSASMGVFVKAGSIMEQSEESGLSHFIEHMAFKGTATRSTRQIAEEIDMLGGNVNAATSKVATSYYARTTDKDLGKAISLLADMLINPQFDQIEFEKEQEVIQEEIAMEADSPEDLVFNLLHEGVYKDQTLSQTILGSKESIASHTLDSLQAFRSKHYQPANAVLSVVGRFDPAQLIDWSEEAFSKWQGQENRPFPENVYHTKQQTLTLNKDVEQAHICLSYPGLESMHEDRFAMAAFSTAFAGGVSSRLFQKIREQEGLVYNIYSAPIAFPGSGEFTVYAACTPKKVMRVIELIKDEAALLIKEGINQQEFMQTMAQMKTNFALGMESAYQRMAAMGSVKLIHDKTIDQKETMAELRKVTLRDVNRIMRLTLGHESVLAAVGKQISKRLK